MFFWDLRLVRIHYFIEIFDLLVYYRKCELMSTPTLLMSTVEAVNESYRDVGR